MKRICHQEIPQYVVDGDIISVFPQTSSKLLDKLISFWSNPWSDAPFHTGIIYIEEDDKVSLLQADPDQHYKVPITLYRGNKLHIIKKLDHMKFDKEVSRNWFSTLSYSYLSAIEAGLNEKVPIKLTKEEKTKCCSQAAVDCWTKMGVKFNSDIISPYSLENYLNWLGFEIIEVLIWNTYQQKNL